MAASSSLGGDWPDAEIDDDRRNGRTDSHQPHKRLGCTAIAFNGLVILNRIANRPRGHRLGRKLSEKLVDGDVGIEADLTAYERRNARVKMPPGNLLMSSRSSASSTITEMRVRSAI